MIKIFLEDNELVRIILVKSGRDAANCWHSLLSNEYSADPWTFNEMEKKLTLERFQKEVLASPGIKIVTKQSQAKENSFESFFCRSLHSRCMTYYIYHLFKWSLFLYE